MNDLTKIEKFNTKMVPMSVVEKIKSKIVEEGAFYKEIGEQDKVDALSVALNIVDACLKEEGYES